MSSLANDASKHHPIHVPTKPVPIWYAKGIKARQDAFSVFQPDPLPTSNLPPREFTESKLENLIPLTPGQDPATASELVEAQTGLINYLKKTTLEADMKKRFGYLSKDGEYKLHPAITDLLKLGEEEHKKILSFLGDRLKIIAKMMAENDPIFITAVKDPRRTEGIKTVYTWLLVFLDGIRCRYALTLDEEFALDTVFNEMCGM